MNKISEAFDKKKAFIPFITAGDPSLEVTEQLLYAMEEAGADLIEIGIPFSDPTAEGVVIQAANERALKAGCTTDRLFDMLEKTENGILLSTQQSLSESMNIDFVDRVVLPELYYNNAAMAQYYFRFIRYTSKHFKNVYFLTYEKSIEMNLLKMVLSKEKINLFMKKQEVGDEELYEYFNVDPQMLQVIMIMESDQEGRLCVTWGEQKIS